MIDVPGCFTFCNISTIDLFIGSSDMRVSYNGKVSLEHVAVIAQLEVEELLGGSFGVRYSDS